MTKHTTKIAFSAPVSHSVSKQHGHDGGEDLVQKKIQHEPCSPKRTRMGSSEPTCEVSDRLSKDAYKVTQQASDLFAWIFSMLFRYTLTPFPIRWNPAQ